jgi:glycerol kinase
MLASVRDSVHDALDRAQVRARDVIAVGLANQGETVIAFDGGDGRPIAPAISWQDRRADEIAHGWKTLGIDAQVRAETGLNIDAYFSAPKLAWILQRVPEARSLVAEGRLRYGASDAWLLRQMTGGRQFVTDSATASRTMLFDLQRLAWSPSLAEQFAISLEGLPAVVPTAAPPPLLAADAIGVDAPITGLCVDQQAALFGHRAFITGQAKITYGTGCFALANVGENPKARAAGLLTSVGWQIGDVATYVFDGGAYSAGSLLDWICRIGLAADLPDIVASAGSIPCAAPAMLVPAFSGLAAPRWSSTARACWTGIDQGADRRHLIRAALEAIAFSVAEIVEAMSLAGIAIDRAAVDGGLAQCDLLMQIQADVLGVPLVRPALSELTAWGVACLAGLGVGLWKSLDALPVAPGASSVFEPRPEAHRRYAETFALWKQVCDHAVHMGDAGLFASR